MNSNVERYAIEALVYSGVAILHHKVAGALAKQRSRPQ